MRGLLEIAGCRGKAWATTEQIVGKSSQDLGGGVAGSGAIPPAPDEESRHPSARVLLTGKVAPWPTGMAEPAWAWMQMA